MQTVQFSFIKGIIGPTMYQFKSNVVHGPASSMVTRILDRPFELLSESLFFTNTRTAVTKTKVSRSMGINFAKLPHARLLGQLSTFQVQVMKLGKRFNSSNRCLTATTWLQDT